jgi:hypothetical protein
MGVHLMGVQLMGVYLIGGRLMGVYLMSVHLIRMHLKSVSFIGVHLTGVHLIRVYLTAHGKTSADMQIRKWAKSSTIQEVLGLDDIAFENFKVSDYEFQSSIAGGVLRLMLAMYNTFGTLCRSEARLE